jgi:probable rRNA maturation factor
MTIQLDLQTVIDESEINHSLPSSEQFTAWLEAGLSQVRQSQANSTEDTDSTLASLDEASDSQSDILEVTIRIVGIDESQHLNHTYREKDKPTNVLSFPFEAPEHIELPFLGDLIICAPVVEQEAEAQQKKVASHWAHLTLHGLLHLLGFDHIEDAEADEMEALEIQVLAKLGIDDPYHDQ